MRILIANIIAIAAVVAIAAAASDEEPVTGPRREVQTLDGGTHLRPRASGGWTTTGAINGGARGLRARKNRGKAGKSGKDGAKSGKGGGGGGAKSGKGLFGGGGAKTGKGLFGCVSCDLQSNCPVGQTCEPRGHGLCSCDWIV